MNLKSDKLINIIILIGILCVVSRVVYKKNPVDLLSKKGLQEISQNTMNILTNKKSKTGEDMKNTKSTTKSDSTPEIKSNNKAKKSVRFSEQLVSSSDDNSLLISEDDIRDVLSTNSGYQVDPMTMDLTLSDSNVDQDLITDNDLIDNGNILGDSSLPALGANLSQPEQPRELINEEPIMSPHPSLADRPQFEMQMFNDELTSDENERVYPINSYSSNVGANLMEVN